MKLLNFKFSLLCSFWPESVTRCTNEVRTSHGTAYHRYSHTPNFPLISEWEWVWEPPNIPNWVKFVVSAPQEQHNAPIEVEFGREERSIGAILHAKFPPDWWRMQVWQPQNSKLGIWSYAVGFAMTQHCSWFLVSSFRSFTVNATMKWNNSPEYTIHITTVTYLLNNSIIQQLVQCSLQTSLVQGEPTFRPSLAWQLTFRGVSKVIIFSSFPLRALSKISSFLYSPACHN